MFWRKFHSKVGSTASFENKDEFLAQKARLFDTPIHEPVRKEIELPSDEEGLGWASGIKTRRWAFKHFDRFEDRIHILHSEGAIYDIGPWRLEQLSDPYLRNFGIDDGPVIGLRFKIYYNSEVIGELEIHPMSAPGADRAKEDSAYQAMLDIEIFPAPFLPHEHLFSFLTSCAEVIFPLEDANKRNAAVVRALTATMWEANRKDSMCVNLSFGYSGSVLFEHDDR